MTTHNTHTRQTAMPPLGFEPTVSADERPQTYAIDRAATGTDHCFVYVYSYLFCLYYCKDHCHRVTTQLQLIVIIIIIIIIIIIMFVYRVTTNVEPEMCDCTSNNWSHWNSNEKLKEKFGNCTGKTFDRFTTKDSCTWNITHNTESTAV